MVQNSSARAKMAGTMRCVRYADPARSPATTGLAWLEAPPLAYGSGPVAVTGHTSVQRTAGGQAWGHEAEVRLPIPHPPTTHHTPCLSRIHQPSPHTLRPKSAHAQHHPVIHTGRSLTYAQHTQASNRSTHSTHTRTRTHTRPHTHSTHTRTRTHTHTPASCCQAPASRCCWLGRCAWPPPPPLPQPAGAPAPAPAQGSAMAAPPCTAPAPAAGWGLWVRRPARRG